MLGRKCTCRAARVGVESGAKGAVVNHIHLDAAGYAVPSGSEKAEKVSAVPLRVGVLGPVTVWRDGHEVMAGQPRQCDRGRSGLGSRRHRGCLRPEE